MLLQLPQQFATAYIRAPPRYDAPAQELIIAVVTLIQLRASPVTLHWVKAHCGHHGNELADKLAKAALSGPPLGPPRRCSTTRPVYVDNQLVDNDFSDAFQGAALSRRIASYHQRCLSQGRWLQPLVDQAPDWQPQQPRPEDKLFVLKARTHTLPTATYTNRWDSLNSYCSLCELAGIVPAPVDTSTHWYMCASCWDDWLLAAA